MAHTTDGQVLAFFSGNGKICRTFLPLYSETSAPLTELLKNTKHWQHRLNWTLECELAFAKIKEDLTSAPVLCHFDSSLRTAVHIDGSQNAVWAVLLQWQEMKTIPVLWHSCFVNCLEHSTGMMLAMWILAAQMALTTWRTLLLGVKFKIFSDHDSLQYLFTQKSPSQRLLTSSSLITILRK